MNDSKVSSYHVYALRIRNVTEQQRDAIMKEIFEKDVSVNVHFIPVPMMSFYRSLGYDVHHYPVTFDNYSREISLPVFYDLDEQQMRTVVDAVVSAVNKVITFVATV